MWYRTLCFPYSAAVRQGITDTVKRALSDAKVKSVVICGQNGVFCGGMDKIFFFFNFNFMTPDNRDTIRTSAGFDVPLRCKMSSVCPFDGDKAEEKSLKNGTAPWPSVCPLSHIVFK